MLTRKLGLSLICLGLTVNIGARIAEYYQNRPRTVTISEFYNITQNPQDSKIKYRLQHRLL